MRRGEVWRYRPVIERSRRSTLRLIVSADALATDDRLPAVYGAQIVDSDPGSLLVVRVGEWGWASMLEIERALRSRLVERIGMATVSEMEVVDTALRATFEV